MWNGMARAFNALAWGLSLLTSPRITSRMSTSCLATKPHSLTRQRSSRTVNDTVEWPTRLGMGWQRPSHSNTSNEMYKRYDRVAIPSAEAAALRV
jgi:hypothetical protein